METPKRYHPLLVTLHWLVAVLVVWNLFIGKFVFPNPDYPERAAAVHMLTGILVLLLVVIRFGVRQGAARPAEAASGSKLLDAGARHVHYGLYALLMVLTLAGVGLAGISGRMARTFLGAGPASGPPPDIVPILYTVHGLSANLLLLLILVHIAAAVYHQFIRKDNLIARMWYGQR